MYWKQGQAAKIQGWKRFMLQGQLRSRVQEERTSEEYKLK